jgi:thiol:disulfide interchange protein
MAHRWLLQVALVCGGAAGYSAQGAWEAHLLPKGFQTANSLDKALTLARSENRHVVLYYTRTNCPPCTVVQGLLRNQAVAQPFREAYVFTAVWGTSINHAERESLRSRYDVQGAPTWVVFRGTGEYLCTARGAFATAAEAAALHRGIQALLASSDASTSGLDAPPHRACS